MALFTSTQLAAQGAVGSTTVGASAPAGERPRRDAISLGCAVVACLPILYPIAFYLDRTVPFYAVLGAAVMLQLVLLVLYRPQALAAAVGDALPFLAFVLVAAASVAWAIEPARTIWRTMPLVIYGGFLLCLLAELHQTRRLPLTPLLYGMPCTVVIVYFLIWQHWGSIRIISPLMKEDVGTFSNYGVAFLLPIIPFLLHRTLAQPRWPLVNIGFLVLIGIALAYSGSRAGLLASALILLAFLALAGRFRWRLMMLAMLTGIAATVCVLVLAVYFDAGAVIGRVVERTVELIRLISGAENAEAQGDDIRLAMIWRSLELLVDTSLLGVGYENIRVLFPTSAGGGVVSHNLWIVTGAGELGLLGFVSALAFSVIAMQRAYRGLGRAGRGGDSERLHAAAILIAIVIVIIHAQFRPQMGNPMFFVVLALALMRPTGAARRPARAAPLFAAGQRGAMPAQAGSWPSRGGNGSS